MDSMSSPATPCIIELLMYIVSDFNSLNFLISSNVGSVTNRNVVNVYHALYTCTYINRRSVHLYKHY